MARLPLRPADKRAAQTCRALDAAEITACGRLTVRVFVEQAFDPQAMARLHSGKSKHDVERGA